MARHSGKYISYLRVSTKGQEASGLGLEAQREAVADWLNGGNWQLVEEVVEVRAAKAITTGQASLVRSRRAVATGPS